MKNKPVEITDDDVDKLVKKELERKLSKFYKSNNIKPSSGEKKEPKEDSEKDDKEDKKPKKSDELDFELIKPGLRVAHRSSEIEYYVYKVFGDRVELETFDGYLITVSKDELENEYKLD